MKITRTADLNILKVAIMGGQSDSLGAYSEGDHSFTINNEHLKTDYAFSIAKISAQIEFYIEEYGDNPFKYYGDWYKFKIPKQKNLLILASRIKKILIENECIGDEG